MTMILLSPTVAALALLSNTYLGNKQVLEVDYKPPLLKQEDIDSYKKIGDDLYVTVQRLLSSKEWTDDIYDGKVETVTLNGTLYFSSRLQLDVLPQVVYRDLWENGESIPSWNPQAEFVKEVLSIEDDIKIMYQTVDAKVPGFSAKRDFVTLKRKIVGLDGVLLMVYKSIDFPSIPEREGYVRGIHGPSAMIVHPFPDEPNKTSFRWIMNTDPRFKWVSKSFTNGIMKATMPFQITKYLEALKTHSEDLMKSSNRTLHHMNHELIK